MANENKNIYTPSHIANYFLDKKNHNIDNLKLNKLVYFAYAWSLIFLNGREIFKEPIQAWRFGPVIPSLYHEFKNFGWHKIEKKSYINLAYLKNENEDIVEPKIEDNDKELMLVLDKIYKFFGHTDSWFLVDITHKKESPWAQTYKENKYNAPIEKNKIENYYKKLINK